MEIGLDQALIVLGGLLVVLAALSGWLDIAVLSTTVLAVASGIALGATGVVTASPGSDALVVLVEVALIVTLFNDGMTVEKELLRSDWRAPARALLLAMPVTLVLTAAGARLLFPELGWTAALLLGAVLMPTDPVITSSIVASSRVPARVRHALTVESGMNDGLALPVVVVLLAVAAGGDAVAEAGSATGEVAGGVAIGAALAAAIGLSAAHLPRAGVADRYVGLLAAGVPLLAYGVADITYGNGLIAAFVAGVVLAVTGRDTPERSLQFNETAATGLQLVVLFAVGTLVSELSWHQDALPLLAFVLVLLLVARPAAIALAFMGTGMRRAETLFIAWFGPKGVASVLFAMLVLGSGAEHSELVFRIAVYAVLGSVALHGLTDSLGVRLIGGRPGEGDRGPGRAAATGAAWTPDREG